MIATGIKKSLSKMYPFAVIIDMNRLFETKEKAEKYLEKFRAFDESIREELKCLI